MGLSTGELANACANAAAEMIAFGHNGWPNTAMWAAERLREQEAELTTTAHALTIAVERCDKLAKALEEACQILENFGFPKAAERLRGVMK